MTYDSSSNPNTPESEEAPKREEELKDLILKGLRRATFHVDLTTKDGIFNADPNVVQAVLDRLRGPQYNLNLDTLLGDGMSSETSPWLPPGGFTTEKHSRERLVHLLNMIVHATNNCLPLTQRHLRRLRFHSYGMEVEEKYVSVGSFKPDDVGILIDLPIGGKISWEESKP
jgi:hypothetical protein